MINERDTPSQSSLLAANAKRFAYHSNNASMLYCIYCTKNDFENLEQLHAHVQQMHAIVLREVSTLQLHKAYLLNQFTLKFTLVFSSSLL